MLDPALLRNQLTAVQASLRHKGYLLDTEAYQNFENQRKHLQSQCERLQATRNQLAKSIGQKKSVQQDASSLLAESERIRNDVKRIETELKTLQQAMHAFLADIPNLPASSAPIGANENDNVVVSTHGSVPSFDFAIQDHIQLAGAHIDTEKAADLCGSRFAFVSGPICQLHRALAQWMLDVHTREHGYLEVNVPVLVKPDALYGTGQLPKFKDDQFTTDADNGLTLIPTAEVPLTNLVHNRMLHASELPMRVCAHSLCFRKEAGSYGKDTHGMFRMHQFEKVELVHVCTAAKANEALQTLTQHAKTILDLLRLPYRVVELCTGDLGFSAQKTFDLEVWLPSQNSYREVSSCSHMGDFQARRMQARYKDANGKKHYAHTLNGSGLALGRTLIAVLENYQQADGSIAIPEVLKPYVREKSIGPLGVNANS